MIKKHFTEKRKRTFFCFVVNSQFAHSRNVSVWRDTHKPKLGVLDVPLVETRVQTVRVFLPPLDWSGRIVGRILAAFWFMV